MWPIPPAARPGARGVPLPPPCACRAERRLEVQILPSVLYGLRVDEGGGGMDFSSLFVYSCADSCAGSNQECIVVLPPAS